MKDSINSHPLVDFILNHAKIDPKYRNMGFPNMEIIYFNEDAKRIIEVEFVKYFDSPDLKDIVIELLKLASVLDEQGHKDAGLYIVMLVTLATESLEKLARKIDSNAEKKKIEF